MAHGTLLNVTWQSGWERSLGEKVYTYMKDKSLRYSPETITSLISYTRKQNKKV